MADPVSAAGFAIGAVSLGIQVCQGLVSYYTDCKSREDDVDRILDKLRGLEETLENLKNGIMNFQSANAKEVDDVKKKISSCDDGIYRLQAVLEKCRSSPSANSVHKFFQKTLYPFKRATLQELDACVSDLQGNLDTGVLSLLLGAANHHRQGLSVLISTSQTREEEFEEVRHGIQNAAAEVGEIRASIQQQTNIIQASTFNISSTLETMQCYQQNHLPELKDLIETLPERIDKRLDLRFDELLLNSQLNKFQSAIAMQKNPARSFQARLIGTPSLLRAACDEIDRFSDAPRCPSMSGQKAYNPSSSRRRFKRQTCFCQSSIFSSELRRPHDSQRHRPIWGAVFRSSAVTHHKSCAFFQDVERKKSWSLRVVYCGRLIAQAITMSIDLSWGAGGCSISPNLSCDRVVSSHSPIFQLIETNCYFAYSGKRSRVIEQIDGLIRDIRQLYQKGKASAHDVDEEGDNIVHKIMKWNFFNIEGILPEVIRLVKQLSDWGVRLDRVNARGLTSLDEWQGLGYFTSVGCMNVIVENMMDLCAEFMGTNDYDPTTFAETARRFEEFAEASDFNDICRAVLRRSESELRNVLQFSHHLIDEANAHGLRALHLSANWPSGIEILLEYGANVNAVDDCGFYPIDHAIELACPESVALLGEADCALRPENREFWGTLGLAIAVAASCDRDQVLRARRIVESVIVMEANQRRKLHALLSHYLPESSIGPHSLFEDKLLDVYAFDAVTALKQHGVAVPISLEFGKYCRTLYHLWYLTPEILNSLWDAGFRDINEPNHTGRTPLMLPNWSHFDFDCFEAWLKRVCWFLAKGVDPEQKIQQIHQNSYWSCNSKVGCPCLKSGHTVMHFLAFNLSQMRSWLDSRHYHLFGCKDTRLLAVAKDIIDNETRDTCKCACSSGGCRAINIIVKENLPTTHLSKELFEEIVEKFFDQILWPIQTTKADDVISETTFSEIVRDLTFHVLDLTHTCCRESDDSFNELQLIPFEDEDDISEIYDEEREDLQLLEDLLLEFEQHRRDSPSSYWKFLSGYWRTRMLEVLSEQESLDEVSEGELLDETSKEESLDEDELEQTGADIHDISSHHSHRVIEVHDDSEDSD